MADVGKEDCLGAVQLGQSFGALALLLIGTGICESGGDLPGDEFDEPRVLGVELAVRVKTSDKDAGRAILALPLEWDDNGALWRNVPCASG